MIYIFNKIKSLQMPDDLNTISFFPDSVKNQFILSRI